MGKQENTFWIYCTCFVAPFGLVISNNIVTMLSGGGGGGICNFVDPHCVGEGGKAVCLQRSAAVCPGCICHFTIMGKFTYFTTRVK